MKRCKICKASENQSLTSEGEIFCIACGELSGIYKSRNQITEEFANTKSSATSSNAFEAQLDILSQKFHVAPDDKVYAIELLKTYRKDLPYAKWPTETAASLMYIVSRHRRPDWLLTDYITKLALDYGKVFKIYKRIQNIIHQEIEFRSGPETQLRFVSSRIFDSLAESSTTSNSGRNALNEGNVKSLTKQIINIAVAYGHEEGRSVRPLVAACMVIAAEALSRGAQTKSDQKKQRRSPNIDWKGLASRIYCGGSTIQYRHTEIVNLLLGLARSLPWLSDEHITRATLADHIDDILAFNDEIPCLIDNAIPAFSRAQMERRKRLRQIADAMTCRTGQSEELDVETRMIYFLLQSGEFTTSVLETMTGSQIRASVDYIYDRQSSKSTNVAIPHDLDRIEVDENDLPDDEALKYIR